MSDLADRIIICAGPPMKEIARKPDGERWCFRCRRRTQFEYVVTAPVEPSYYGPEPSIRCTQCDHADTDLGFGRYREWEE